MRTLMRMLVMSMAAVVMPARGGAGLDLWTRGDAARLYTRELAREYEPYMFAAVPLHAPVPVLRVLSPAPLSAPAPRLSRQPRPYATSVQHTSFTRPYAERPYADPGQYAESRPYTDVRPYAESSSYDTRQYQEPHPYGAAGSSSYDTRQYKEPRPYGAAGSSSYDTRQYKEPRPYGAAGSSSYDTRQYKEPRPYSAAGSRPYVDAVELYETTAHEAGYSRGGTRRPAAPAVASSELAVEWDGLALPLVNAGALGRVALAAGPTAPEESPSSAEVSVLYARPSPAGGYLYRKLPNKAPLMKVASSKEQPVVVKIHKHKIIKS